MEAPDRKYAGIIGVVWDEQSPWGTSPAVLICHTADRHCGLDQFAFRPGLLVVNGFGALKNGYVKDDGRYEYLRYSPKWLFQIA